MRKNGFTLIELMVVVIIIGILAGLTLPGILGSLPARRLKDARSQMVGDLNLARQMSMSRDQDYSLGVVNSTQYRVFIDKSSPRNGTYDAGDQIINTASLPRTISFASTVFSIGFNPSGIVNNSTINPLVLRNSKGMVDTIMIMQSGSIF